MNRMLLMATCSKKILVLGWAPPALGTAASQSVFHTQPRHRSLLVFCSWIHQIPRCGWCVVDADPLVYLVRHGVVEEFLAPKSVYKSGEPIEDKERRYLCARGCLCAGETNSSPTAHMHRNVVSTVTIICPLPISIPWTLLQELLKLSVSSKCLSFRNSFGWARKI